MLRYDPDVAPAPDRWLKLDEQLKIRNVMDYHRRKRIPLDAVQLHAALHVVVENQLAEGFAPAVRALERLLGEGLSRHDAIHAISFVAMSYLLDLTSGREAPNPDHAAYARALDELTKGKWYADAEDDETWEEEDF
jgi:hypothetical protein